MSATRQRHRGFQGRIGVARREITPDADVRVRCWGPAESDYAIGVHRPLTLTALVLLDEREQPAVLVAADLTWWRRAEEEERLRRSLLDAFGLPEERLLVHLAHTHAGPTLAPPRRSLGPEVDSHEIVAASAALERYLDAVAVAAIEAVATALVDAVPARLEWALGRCGLARVRDLIEGDRVLVGFDPEPAEPADDALLVGRITRCEDDSPLATLVNYACHPTTLAWENQLVSPDFAGALRELVEAETKAPCAFLQGASGELAPSIQYVGDTAVADRHGRALGHATLGVLETMLPPGHGLRRGITVESGASLAAWELERVALPSSLLARRIEVELAVRERPSEAELRRRWAGAGERSVAERLDRATRLWLDFEPDGSLRYPLWIWRIGDSALVAHPGEAYSLLQRRLREHAGDAVAVLNLTNGAGFFYLPPAALYETDAYPCWQTPVAAGSLETIVESAISGVAELESERVEG